jgi:hypothetical protein
MGGCDAVRLVSGIALNHTLISIRMCTAVRIPSVGILDVFIIIGSI